MVAVLLAALDSTIVATALPTIVAELGGLAHLSWVVTAYLLAQTVATPLYGKLGDLYGRKGVLQTAIVLFLAGSVLCGLSRTLSQLILFRALQGLGGGGLIVTSQAVIGDLVSPRERGRYQGIFGAVFGAASVAGPLLGGFFTANLSWRWIFYVNLPLGIAGLTIVGAALPSRLARVERTIDFAGATLLAIALIAIVLVCDLGGTTYPWTSTPMLAMLAGGAGCLAAFIAVERHAKEPLLPLRLFGDRTFVLTSLVGFVVGFALFGSVTYLPLFLQAVKHASPAASGLQMLPMMAGMPLTSILVGQLVSRTGRYKWFPVIGTAVMTAALGALSKIAPETPQLSTAMLMLLLGVGLGLVMQVLVIAVQNSAAYSDLGVVTSGAMLFRLVGGSIGTAVLGAVLASRLGGVGELANGSVQALAAHGTAFTYALDRVFLVAMFVAAAGVALAWLIPERRLRDTVAAATADAGENAGESFGMPVPDDADLQILRGVTALADRDVQRQHIRVISGRAGLELTALAAWLLWRLGEDQAMDPRMLAADYRIDETRMDTALEELKARGYVAPPPARERRWRVTAAGCRALERFVMARRARLEELFHQWEPADRRRVADLLRGLAKALVHDAPTAT